MIEIKVFSKFNDKILDFLIDESFLLFVKLKGFQNISQNDIQILKDKLRTLYISDKQESQIYVAFLDNVIIGCACITYDGYLRDLFVKEEYQHHGIGSLLLRHISYDTSNITLTTYPELAGFYSKNGFTLIKQHKDFIQMKK